MRSILFWPSSVMRWSGSPKPTYGIDLIVVLLIGALGLRVFPAAL